MHSSFLSRLSAKQRSYGLVGAVFIIMAAVALVTLNTLPSGAQVATTTTANCVPTPAPAVNTLTCAFATSTTIAPGGTMTIELTNPLGANLLVTGAPVGCAVTTGTSVPSGVSTVACAIASLGMKSGTILTETITGAAVTGAQFVTESLTYNANGAAPQVPSPNSESAAICSPALVAAVSPQLFTCTPTATTVDNGTLTITAVALAGGSLQIITPTAPWVGGGETPPPALSQLPIGPCPLSTAVPQPANPGGTAVITWTCPQGAGIPGQPIPPAPPPPGQIPITFTVAFTGGIQSLTITENANGSTSTQIAFPEILTVGPCKPFPVPSTAGTTTEPCPIPPFPSGIITQAGSTLNFQITGAVEQTLFVNTGGAPATVGPCSLTTALPTSVTQPEGTLVISYSCDINQSVSAPPGVSVTPITVTSGNGVAGTPIEVIAKTDPGPPPGIPAPNTTAVTFTISGISSPTASSPVVTGISPTSGPTGGGTSVTISGNGFTGCANVSFGTFSVSATPSSDTKIVVSSPGSTLPSPGTGVVDVTVGGGNCTTSATSAADKFTYATGGGGVASPTPIATATPVGAGAAGFCTGATPTPAPGSPCITQNSNCVNPAGAALPAVPGTQTAGGTGVPPSASAGGPYIGSTGQPLQFLGTVIPAPTLFVSSCSWNFGDGSPASRFLSPTHLYAVAGTYTATLTVIDSTGVQTVVTAQVRVGASPPLCQQPAITGTYAATPCQAAGCPTASFNNGCQPVCPWTLETLLPGQCPGPATGSSIWINGPFQLGVNQPVTVNVNTNLPATSSLLTGDTIKFDWGDGAVNYNTPPPGAVAVAAAAGAAASTTASCTAGATQATTGATATAAGATTATATCLSVCADATTSLAPGGCQGHGGLSPQSSGYNAFPAPMQNSHAYTQPGSYLIKVIVTFSDGTGATAQTQAVVGGSAASLNIAPQGPPQLLTAPVTLQAGCNNVTLTFPNGTNVSQVAAAVQSTTVSSIYETPAGGAPNLAYYPNPQSPGNLVSVQHGDAAVICVSGPGTLVQPVS